MIEIKYTGIDKTRDLLSSYEEIYAQHGILHRDSLYILMLDILKPEKNKILVDVACGEGRLVRIANERKLKAFGLDISYYALLKGKKLFKVSNLLHGDGEFIPIKSESVDYVVSLGSLEHYLNPEAGVREISRILKGKGKACVLLPNAYGLLGTITYVSKYGDVPDDGQPIQRYGTRVQWEKLLSHNGLRITKVYPYNEIEFPRTFRDLMWILVHPRKLVKLIISIIVPLDLCNHFIFLCQKD